MRDRDFRLLWFGQTASQLGEHTTAAVLPLIAVLALNATPADVGLLRAFGQAPFLLLALFAGAWVDRWRTRDVMVAADLTRAVALTVAAVAGLALPGLFVVALVVGGMSVLFDIAYQASIPRLLRRDQLITANSALEGTRSAAQLGGPALGGALVSLLPAAAAIGSGALFFATSFLSIRALRADDPEHRSRTRIRDGLRFVAGQPVLRAVGLASAAFQFSFAGFMTAFLVFLPRDLGLSAGAIGLVLAATGPGALVGSLLAARLPGLLGYGVTVVGAALIGDGVALVVPALHGSPAWTFPLLLAVMVIFGAGGQLVNVTVMAIRQAVTPAAMQGRVAATITFAGMGTQPLGSLAGGLLAGASSPRTTLVAAAAAMLLSPLVLALSPVRRWSDQA
ncbi:MFS transporter [Actinoplanes sp. NPDC089786]|uniref:MFS transporter n=1 Tax=Actinoplanes sp. NPDC089786 TaxID=3155185 RepID=UPI0034343CAB